MPLTSTDDIENVTTTVTNDVDQVSNGAPFGREHAKSNNATLRDNVDDNDDAHIDTGITITLISNDDRVFHVPLEAAKLSGFIVDTLGLDDDDDDIDDENENQENDDDTTNKPPQRLHEKQYEPIIVPRVNGEILQLIVDFLLHYKYVNPMPKIQQPIVAETFHDVMTDLWYQQYVTQHEQDDDDGDHNNSHNNTNMIVFQILHAANFMEISPIIDLTCLWCTFQISRKSTEEIRVFLNLPKMTPEEEAQARADHPWIFESITPS